MLLNSSHLTLRAEFLCHPLRSWVLVLIKIRSVLHAINVQLILHILLSVVLERETAIVQVLVRFVLTREFQALARCAPRIRIALVHVELSLRLQNILRSSGLA